MKKFSFKICYDIIMTVLMLLLMVYSLTGGYLHELFGIIAVLMFVFHVLINIKWVCSVFSKTFKGRSSGLDKIKFILTVLLCVLVIFTGLSGILISCSFFTDIYAMDRALWVYIHNLSAYCLLIIISVHTGMHWKMIMAFFRKKLELQENGIRKFILRLIALILALLGIKAHTDKDFINHFIPDLPEKNPEKTASEDAFSMSITYDDNKATAHTVPNTIHTQQVGLMNISDSSSYKAVPLRGDYNMSYDFSAVPPTQNEALEEYLGRLRCTGCSKRCFLISPRCNTGVSFASQATDYYNSFLFDDQNDDESSAETQEDNTQSQEDETVSESSPSESTTDNSNTQKTEEKGSSTKENNPDATDPPKAQDKQEIVLSQSDDEDNTGLKDLFTTMIPVMSLYISGTYYILKIGQKIRKK